MSLLCNALYANVLIMYCFVCTYSLLRSVVYLGRQDARGRASRLLYRRAGLRAPTPHGDACPANVMCQEYFEIMNPHTVGSLTILSASIKMV